ncbi:MAG: hypothetical protein WAU39_16500 [Polyangiales bacterium]
MSSSSSAEATESYRIPKHRVCVEIACQGGEPEEVSIFLSPRAAFHPGRERPSDLLFGEEPFLTMMADDGAVRFVNKDAIAWMTVAPELELSGRHDLESQFTTQRCRPIDLTLDDGRNFVGEVAIVLPEGSCRLQDFLNSAARFFEVRDGRAVHFVNRDRVVMVRATE